MDSTRWLSKTAWSPRCAFCVLGRHRDRAVSPQCPFASRVQLQACRVAGL